MVEIRLLSGKTITITSLLMTCRDIKKLLAATLGLPAVCLELVADDIVLHDCEEVEASASLLMTVSTEKVCALVDLKEGVVCCRDAVDALSRVARKGDKHVTDSVRPCLKNANADLRASAVCTLGKVVCPDADEAVFVELSEALDDAELSVRIAAVEALADIAYEANPATTVAMDNAINDLTKLLESDEFQSDKNLWLRNLRALAKAMKTHHDATISAFIFRLENLKEDCLVRRMVAGALIRIARNGNTRAANVLQAQRDDSDIVIRRTALKCCSDRGT
eukprot:TRINITY_DN105340_c0_g1_i1.p1 TRINITY_DN105340_c0_g1~~TRINITY_DN105340_c0_g1_i1.p1  ORF type:complete len:326 (-),score=48.88 TRINITY_DN105340_c0_g1_i1:527-1363(-)